MSESPSSTTTNRVRRGRFAPSPTGDLHMGSLVAAVASYLEARTGNAEWLVRIEDLDPPRVVPGSAERILRSLEHFGFRWDGPVLYQSTRAAAYQDALDRLLAAGDAYPCACSRAEITGQASRTGAEGPVYPGTCRNGVPHGRDARAVRLRTPGQAICLEDALQGRTCQDIGREIGDFVIRRADGWFAYQLAVVVDDAWQGVTDVVRGADLLSSTPRQVWLQRRLGLPTPRYVHIPLLLDDTGRKLSKSASSLPVDPARPAATLVAALELLRQSPPRALRRASTGEIWDWATANWQVQRLTQLDRLTVPVSD